MLDDEAVLASKLRALMHQDARRVEMIETAESVAIELELPEAMLAAGFLRNCVWDYLHRYPPAPCNDVDLIYFDTSRISAEDDYALEQRLVQKLPSAVWEVKNQARMSKRHGDPRYTSAVCAMRYWPEQETAVAMTLDGSRRIISPFGLSGLFAGKITVGPHRSSELMEHRAKKKGWFDRWPNLKVANRKI